MDMVVTGFCTTELPVEWSQEPNIDWKVKVAGVVGPSPIAWDERVQGPPQRPRTSRNRRRGVAVSAGSVGLQSRRVRVSKVGVTFYRGASHDRSQFMPCHSFTYSEN